MTNEFEKELERNLTLDTDIPVERNKYSKAHVPEGTKRPLPPPASPMPGKPYEAVAKAREVDGYEELSSILQHAYEQSAKGKGHKRHADSPVGFRRWVDQPILANARQVGPAGPAQQVMKKAQESVGMAARGDFVAAKQEVLGVIVYAAALYRLYEEMELVDET